MDGNGSRRRALRARVLAEETLCALCDKPVDKTLGKVAGEHGPSCADQFCPGCAWDPMSPVVDEDVPRARGGSQYDRANCHLMHRKCNRWKDRLTLAEARAKRSGVKASVPAPIAASPIW